MKFIRFFCIAFIFAGLAAAGLPAQSATAMSLSGATGLYSIPSGRIGWERGGGSAFGIDFGYHTIMADGNATSIPKISATLFNTVELSGAFDIRPEEGRGNDFIGGAKVQLPLRRTSLALGAVYQSINIGEHHEHFAWQMYVAATYSGAFFDMPAQTTVVIGRTFRENHSNTNIDFGMGFDLLLLPNIFENLVHWITEFANFSYSVAPFQADAWYRGIVNTGVRLNLASIPAFSRFRFAADIMLVDAFDHNRAFSFGMTFGIPLL
ncbi:MAG: hypothetical protein FWC65_04305 [Treponema sp.]|nr:hypothetical protein [Treponema sp.]